MTTILFTGGSGLLGSEFKKQYPSALYPTHKELDVTDKDSIETYFKLHSFSTVVHLAAFISPPKINENPRLALKTNICGSAYVVDACIRHSKKLVYLSTDYVFSGKKGNYKEEDAIFPVNKYAWSKLGGECAVRLSDNYLIIRTSFGPNVFPHEKAFIDQWTSRETVSVIAKKVGMLINKNATGVFHVGGKKRSVFDYATEKKRKVSIQKASIKDVPFLLPTDTSLNTNKYKKFIKNGKI